MSLAFARVSSDGSGWRSSIVTGSERSEVEAGRLQEARRQGRTRTGVHPDLMWGVSFGGCGRIVPAGSPRRDFRNRILPPELSGAAAFRGARAFDGRFRGRAATSAGGRGTVPGGPAPAIPRAPPPPRHW